MSAANSDGIESAPSSVIAVIRTLYFDPNGNSDGSVTDGGSFPWRAANWAVVSGGAAVTNAWQPGKLAVFAATSPALPLAYAVDLAGYDTGSHGNFAGIRAQAGTVSFTGNASNFYLTSPASITADPGAAIVFQQTRSGADVLAFNLNGQPATFYGDITLNCTGIGNNGTITVGSGHLKLGNAIANFSPAATTLETGTTLTNIGDAGKSFNLDTLTMNGSTLAAANPGNASWGNYVLRGGLTVGGSSTSEIAADIRCQPNTNQTLYIGETGQDVDLRISGKIGHINGIAWSHATKTGPGTLLVSGVNDLGSLTVNEGTAVLDGGGALSGMGNGGLVNQSVVEFRIPDGAAAYGGAISGDGTFMKSGDGTLELGAAKTINQRILINRGVLKFNQGSLQRTAQVSIASGARIDLAFTGSNTIRSLEIAGTALPPGIYHAGTHPDFISGSGRLKVAAATSLAWNNSAATNVWNATDANWTGQSWIHLSDAVFSHTSSPQSIALTENLSAVDVTIGNGGNNANYTLVGNPDSCLTALSFTIQGASSNDPGLGTAMLTNLSASISTDLRVGRWDLVIGGSSAVDIAGQLRASSDGNGLGDWGRVTIQDAADVMAAGGVTSAGAAWGLSLNGGTLTTPNIRVAENTYGAGCRLTLNGTTLRATQPTSGFLTVDSTNQAYVGSNGARFDTNGSDIGVGVKLVDVPGQAGSLHKLGAGTLALSSASTITGQVVVDGGTLFANPGNAATNRAFSSSSGITVNHGGTLRTATNGLFGWDGSQAKPITVNQGGTAVADAGGDINVGLVTLNGGTLAGGPFPSWGSWSFGRATDRKLAATGNSTVSASDVALFGGATVEVAAEKTLSFTGTIVNTSNGASALIKTGAGTLQLSGNNTYSGTTTVRSGRLDLTGSIAAGGDLMVADQSEPAVFLNSGTATRTLMRFGNGAGSIGAGFQSSGAVTTTLNAGNAFGLGHGANSYGFYRISGGSLQTQEIAIGTCGDANNGGSGMLEITGGSVNNLGWLVMNRSQGANSPTQHAVLDVSGGILNYQGGGLIANWGSSAMTQFAVINVSQTGSIATLNHSPISLGGGVNTGILNLNGGNVEVSAVTGTSGLIHFHGGTLKPSTDSGNFLAVHSARILSGGAVIDTNAKSITIHQALLAPTAQGVVELPVLDGGSGFTCTPIVKFTGGNFTIPATAVPIMEDDGSGRGTLKIAAITITSPGACTEAPSGVSLIGTGSATPAAFGTAVLGDIASGSLTKSGNGTLTLTATNRYTGGTIVTAGTLAVSGNAATLGAGDLTISAGASVSLQNPNGSLADNASVNLAATAMLEMSSGVTESVKFLRIDGVLQPAGTYNAANRPDVISGTGSLVVSDLDVVVQVSPDLSLESWRDVIPHPLPNADGEIQLVSDAMSDPKSHRFRALAGPGNRYFRIAVRQAP